MPLWPVEGWRSLATRRSRNPPKLLAPSRPSAVGILTLQGEEDVNDLPAAIGKKLPRYPTVPTVRMGRLAVDQAFKGQGLGGALLADALDRAARSEIAAYALMVDAKDDDAAAFYQHHGFIALPDAQRTLFLPLATVQR